jgi:DNA-directed RNA polymerase I subunit RPA49
MNTWEVDNLITHLSAMSLYIDGWESDTTDLKDDIRMDINKLLPYFRELGCRTGGLSEKDRNSRNLTADRARPRRMAKLLIPLEFPQLSRIRGRGR